MRLVSYGELYLDYYFIEDEIYIAGGKTNANILCNLSKYYKTKMIGVIGDDQQGRCCVEDLEYLGIDTSNIKCIEGQTRVFFSKEDTFTKRCPICKEKKDALKNVLTAEELIKQINKDDNLILDTLGNIEADILNKTNNHCFIDIGYPTEYMSIEYLRQFEDRFDIINMNERVCKHLEEIGISKKDLYNILTPNLLIITKGEKGAEFYFKDNSISISPKEIIKSNYTEGAGDMFFSIFIKNYIENDYNVDINYIKKSFYESSEEIKKVMSHYGARHHLEPLHKIKEYKKCICKDIIY